MLANLHSYSLGKSSPVDGEAGCSWSVAFRDRDMFRNAPRGIKSAQRPARSSVACFQRLGGEAANFNSHRHAERSISRAGPRRSKHGAKTCVPFAHVKGVEVTGASLETLQAVRIASSTQTRFELSADGSQVFYRVLALP